MAPFSSWYLFCNVYVGRFVLVVEKFDVGIALRSIAGMFYSHLTNQSVPDRSPNQVMCFLLI